MRSWVVFRQLACWAQPWWWTCWAQFKAFLTANLLSSAAEFSLFFQLFQADFFSSVFPWAWGLSRTRWRLSLSLIFFFFFSISMGRRRPAAPCIRCGWCSPGCPGPGDPCQPHPLPLLLSRLPPLLVLQSRQLRFLPSPGRVLLCCSGCWWRCWLACRRATWGAVVPRAPGGGKLARHLGLTGRDPWTACLEILWWVDRGLPVGLPQLVGRKAFSCMRLPSSATL